MMSIFSVTGAGAKGKFCGGVDIAAFVGLQGGKSMCIGICLSYFCCILKFLFVHSSTTKTGLFIGRDSY